MSDLFLQEETERTEGKAPPAEHWVSVVCDCGKKIGARMSHWEVLVCPCGRRHWALRPKRSEPLVLFPWPGDYPSGAMAGRAA